jgi:quinohemoprotein ethanol dehydrogenase
MKKSSTVGLIVLVLFALSASAAYTDPGHVGDRPRILLFSKTQTFRHPSIPIAIAALQRLGEQRGWDVDATEDAEQFTDRNLRRYDVVVWLNTSGHVLDPKQQAAYERFHRSGRGTVAIHEGGTDTEREGWPWYRRLASTLFIGHPEIQTAHLHNVDPTHPTSAPLPCVWEHTEEWYNFASDPSPDAHVLLEVDEHTYSPGEGAMLPKMGVHPIAWYKEFDGGRYFYTALGHTSEDYSDSLFLAHVAGAIEWAAGRAVNPVPSSERTNDCEAAKTDGTKPVGNITTERLLNAEASEPGSWLTAGRDWRQSYYSPLTQINRENVKRLGFAWAYDIPFDSGFQATPIAVDGLLVTSGNHGDVYALDARTGVLRWSFKPPFNLAILGEQCCSGVNRGVAVWHGKVYVAAVDGELYALNTSDGSVAWKVDTVIDHARSYSSTGAPYIAKDSVVIGNSGAEYDTRGYVSAYDVDTGKLAWRFFTVPGDPKKGFEQPELKMAAKTWGPKTPWNLGLGGAAWDGMAYDPNLNLLYVGTGNGLPWNRKLRSPSGGDNLFASSIVAINASTGRLAWYYQTTPGDNWDYDATQKFILADLTIDGKSRKVIMQAPKNGFFYVLDRVTGELLSAKPYVYTNWASRVDMKTGRPVETGRTDYSNTPKLVFPTNQGGHNWNPMSFNPRTGLVYIPVLQTGEIWGNDPAPFKYQKGQWNVGVRIAAPLPSQLGQDTAGSKDWPSLDTLRAGEPDPAPRTFLRAWDPLSQSLIWQVETTGGSGHPVPWARSSARQLSGVMSTATGLVFQGDIDGHLRVFDASTGNALDSVDVGTSMIAAPMTYSIGGEQYVAVMAGANAKDPAYADYEHGNHGRIIAFRLGGGKVPQLPVVEQDKEHTPQPPVYDLATPEVTAAGGRIFELHCTGCHAAGGRAPDLTRMSPQTHREFLDIVLKGTRASKGMGNFGEVLTQKDAEAIYAYIVHSSWKKYEHEQEQELSTNDTKK